jgi:hypothetical protein
MSSNMTGQPLDPPSGSARAVQNAATALELNRGRLRALLDNARRNDGSGFSFLLSRLIGTQSGDETLRQTPRPWAEKHPYGLLAAGAAAGGLACLALPRVAAGLVVPILWAEGRQLVQGMLHGWLRERS